MALFLVQHDRRGAQVLADSIRESLQSVRQCTVCRNLSDAELCTLCANPRRDKTVLCVVETPADVVAIEQANVFSGRYFVLHGRLSPIDGIGPRQLGLDHLVSHIASNGVREVILATNPTVEGEATAQFIRDAVRDDSVLITRIAHGVPVGGELEYVDGGTLAHALRGRQPIA